APVEQEDALCLGRSAFVNHEAHEQGNHEGHEAHEEGDHGAHEAHEELCFLRSSVGQRALTSRSRSAWLLNTDTDTRRGRSAAMIVAAMSASFSRCAVAAASFSSNATIGVSFPFGVSDR